MKTARDYDVLLLVPEGNSRPCTFGGAFYFVFDDGRIWSCARREFVTPDIDDDGYMIFRGFKVHRLVLAAFDRPPKPREVVRHLDGKPWNNHISNLKWGTHIENWEDKRNHGTAPVGEKHKNSKLQEKQVLAIRAAEYSRSLVRELAIQYSVSESTIRLIRSNKIWQQ